MVTTKEEYRDVERGMEWDVGGEWIIEMQWVVEGRIVIVC